MPSAAGDMTMPFGVHKGTKLRDCPIEYLDWLIGQDWLHKGLKTTITEYLKTQAGWKDPDGDEDRPDEDDGEWFDWRNYK